jgi:hypothetical protein
MPRGTVIIDSDVAPGASAQDSVVMGFIDNQLAVLVVKIQVGIRECQWTGPNSLEGYIPALPNHFEDIHAILLALEEHPVNMAGTGSPWRGKLLCHGFGGDDLTDFCHVCHAPCSIYSIAKDVVFLKDDRTIMHAYMDSQGGAFILLRLLIFQIRLHLTAGSNSRFYRRKSAHNLIPHGFNDIAIMPLYDRHYGIQALSDFMVGDRISKRFIEPDALADISEHN